MENKQLSFSIESREDWFNIIISQKLTQLAIIY